MRLDGWWRLTKTSAFGRLAPRGAGRSGAVVADPSSTESQSLLCIRKHGEAKKKCSLSKNASDSKNQGTGEGNSKFRGKQFKSTVDRLRGHESQWSWPHTRIKLVLFRGFCRVVRILQGNVCRRSRNWSMSTRGSSSRKVSEAWHERWERCSDCFHEQVQHLLGLCRCFRRDALKYDWLKKPAGHRGGLCCISLSSTS